ncbi:NAD(P)-dependent oxidoreductase [Cellulomonas fimi]|uniref:NAD-dependent epimerase/dehydratase n=1 Tax=Cellulomonas fimi (strain ATCC 484 / DSM 20113 / JCM 1341 / CCUG 24087 / LMG 16345 / NBRC 15513 / NCIMB 8980 / NCTC 7547 / NRS-133) TaxID=590998 RepID=F4H3D0_CELFA|nr:NAD(P)-binding oxidoreductase [Cellulomonas fimi]AEE45351.1 NAD-dependent epimerase/dehydratase [Cellulomonas fimi ATCC 484]NNH08169.1 SDR family oxidoreductase [Cellulomonas fimi]VEH29067.1 Putative NADH-flavin reductase [Cellulomonas fimi]
MKVLVVGATGGSGRATVAELVRRGHDVTALSRHAAALTGPNVRGVDGDATDPATVDALVAGQDAVVVTLGISEDPVRVRLRGPAGTPIDVRSRGTRTVTDAMRRHGVRRIVVQSSYGVGSTRGQLPLGTRLVFALLLKPQIADEERRTAELRATDLDWVEVQPVYLTDDDVPQPAFTSLDGDIRSMKVSRAQVARVHADAIERTDVVRRTVAVSHDPATAGTTAPRRSTAPARR